MCIVYMCTYKYYMHVHYIRKYICYAFAYCISNPLRNVRLHIISQYVELRHRYNFPIYASLSGPLINILLPSGIEFDKLLYFSSKHLPKLLLLKFLENIDELKKRLSHSNFNSLSIRIEMH